MSYQIEIAPSDTADIAACRFADEVQNACNMVAVVGAWHKHLLALSRAGCDTSTICNHPSTLLMVSKLIALSRFTDGRESSAFTAVSDLLNGNPASYEVIPL